ncbi:hypothetical protein [Yoonia sp. 208BN28-4]
MSFLPTVFANVTFFEICAALMVVGLVERGMLRFAPRTWLQVAGMTQ